MRTATCALLELALLLVSVSHAAAQNWDRFRGPNGAGQSDADGIPTEWTPETFLWKLPLAGVGHSSPVVWDSRLFVASADAETGEQILYSMETTSGTTLWERRFQGSTYRLHGFNSYASSTPALDANHAYFLWLADGRMLLAALTHDGREVWRRDIGPFAEEHGFGKSPIVVDNLVIVATDSDAESAIVALDAISGDERWRLPRPSGTTAFATPCLLDPNASKKQLVAASTASGLAAIDVASGKLLWQGLQDDLTQRCVSSPIVAGGLVFVSCGSGGNGKLLLAVRPGDNERQPKEVFRLKQSIPNVPTPVVAGDLVFLWHDRGVVSCHDIATGRQHWRERIGGDFHSSPLRIGKRIFCASRDGEMVVIAADREFRLLARNLLDEPVHATPAVADDRLFIRTTNSLLCVGQP